DFAVADCWARNLRFASRIGRGTAPGREGPMKGLLLVLFWPEAVWRPLRDTPLEPGRLMFRLVLPLALACAFALQIGTAGLVVDPDRVDARFVPLTAPILFATWL